MARTRRVVPVSEKIEAKKAEIAKVEEKLAKLQNELKELQIKADAEKKKELLDLIMKSDKTEDEIKEFFSK